MPGLLTIGHSNRPLREFLELLSAHRVQVLVDVRTIPRSRHNPQFNRESLPGSLRGVGIDYAHLPGLGGLRKPRTDSPNTGWRNLSFRGYADYMQTPQFEQQLAGLIDLARERRVAMMCAESVPWRCHRSLIADALAARDVEVFHIMSPERTEAHKLTAFAHVEDGCVSYPPADMQLF